MTYVYVSMPLLTKFIFYFCDNLFWPGFGETLKYSEQIP